MSNGGNKENDLFYLQFLYPGTIWLSSCHRCTEAGRQAHTGNSYHREELSCNKQRMRSRTFIVGMVCRLDWLFSCFLTWQNNPHLVVSSCYFSEGLGLADLQTLDFHTMPASLSSAFFLHRCSFHLRPLGSEKGHPPGPGSGKQALRRQSRWKGRDLLQTSGRGD